jgi:hypothetical protein
MKLAHLAIFAYNRKAHLSKTIEALLENNLINESSVTIFSDGAKDINDQTKVKEVRDYIRTINGFKSIEFIEQDTNIGLSKSIISGVSYILSKYESIIVLEDDIVTSNFFLTYMNESLNIYENDNDVISIHGFCLPINQNLPDTFFLKGADCWGWATWRRGWAFFESDPNILYKRIMDRNLKYEFDYNSTYSYTKMLQNQISGKVNSWAIRWYASAFLENKLTLYPGKTLVKNIGNDNSGTHGIDYGDNYNELFHNVLNLEKIQIIEDLKIKGYFIDYYKLNNKNVIKKIIARIIFLMTKIKNRK